MSNEGADRGAKDPRRIEPRSPSSRKGGTVKIPLGSKDPDESIETDLQEFSASQAVPPRVEGYIGSGGMGTIEVVFDPRLRRRLARKTLATEFQNDRKSFQDFINEARITGRLEHPNIVPVHDLQINESGKISFTMKRVEGETLETLLQEAGSTRFEHRFMYRYLDILTRVCEAVAFAHSQNVVHLDIKPGNIMVGDFGQVYLMDWGIARVKGVAHESPQVPCVVGTPIYMPPEQALARDELLDERSDVFTLGGTLFEFLTLQAPFEAETINGAVILAQECKLEDPKDLVSDPRLPAELRRIALKALQSNRDDRYQSVLEFREDLLRFMRGGFEFPTVDLPKGSLIIEEGEVGEDAYVIVSGACRVFQRHGMETRELAVLGPGAVFGEMAILSAAPRAASIEATEQTHLLVINRSVIEQELDSMKPWMGALIRAFAKHALGERPRGSKNI